MNKLRIVFLLMFLCVLSNLTARITFGLTDSDGQKLSKLSQTVNIHSFDADDDKSAEAYADVINMDGEEVELAAAFKKVSQGNPLLSNHFCADPTAIEYEGRLYVYGTNDQQEFEVTKGKSNNTYGKINQLVCMSTDDMVNWTYHGVINVKAIAPWIWTSWAPSIVSKKQSDGKTHFYLYFTNSAAGIGVLTSTSPTGPWRDPLGRALIDGRTPGLGEMSNIIDPGVAISDDESEAYLTFGGGDVKGTNLKPGNTRIVKLGKNMISLASSIEKISAPCQFEANELNYIGGKWVFSYCTRWTIASDWSSYYSGPAPTACSMVYMTATDPLADDWTYKGEFMKNPGQFGYPYGNNHTHIQKFKDKYYLFYHTQWLEKQMGISGGYRNIQMSRIVVSDNTGKIAPMTSSTASISGLGQASTVDAFEEHSSAMSAVSADDWWVVRGVSFASVAKSLVLKVKGTGKLQVYLNHLETAPIAEADFNTLGEKTVTVPLSGEVEGLHSYLYFVKKLSGSDSKIVSWQFSPFTEEELTGVDNVETCAEEADGSWYTVDGKKLSGKPVRRGFYIHHGKKVVL